MDEQNKPNQQIAFLLSNFNLRLRDLEEKNKIIRERILLLGQNLVSLKENLDIESKELKKQINQIQKNLEKLNSLGQNIVSETDKFARKEEILTIERMLKDFQPLEFIREKDIDEIITKKLKEKENKKTKSE